VPVVASAWNPQ
jgi:WD repeat-containing protein 35